MQHWGIKGKIKVADVVRFAPDASAQDPNQLSLDGVHCLMRPDVVDRVTNNVHFNNQHNDGLQVPAVINGRDVFVLAAPNTRIASDNMTLLEDHVQSSEEMCCILVGHLLHAETLSPDQLPLEVPLTFFSKRMQTRPHAITGSFTHVKKVNDAGAIVILCGRSADGMQLTDPVVTQPPALPTIPVAPPMVQPPAPGGAPPVAVPIVPDPNAVLLQGVLTAIQAMTQMNVESNLRNASMTQQQSSLQAAAMRANQLQLQHLTNHLGNLGQEVGKAIASHPTHHNHAIQATLSPLNVTPGQSNDPRESGSLMRVIPVSMSVPLFNCGPCVQAFQPQPNDKHARRKKKTKCLFYFTLDKALQPSRLFRRSHTDRSR